MKLLHFFILTFVSVVTLQNHALAQIDKGYLKLEITDIKSDDQMMQSQLNMMKGTTMGIYFSQTKSKSVTEMMGGMAKIVRLINPVTAQNIMLFDVEMMGQKTLIDMSDQEENKSKVNFEVFKDDVKEILGFKAFKVRASVGDGANQVNMDLYVTEEITTPNGGFQGMDFEGLTGCPLEFVMKGPGFEMVYSATEFKKEISDADFEVNTAGYEKKTMEEFQKSMGGMGGMF